jgi:hypothetical protein
MDQKMVKTMRDPVTQIGLMMETVFGDQRDAASVRRQRPLHLFARG